jgi:hypothetical protein
MTPRLPALRIAATRIRTCRRGQRLQTSKKLAAARAELHRLRAINCAAKTQRDPDATLNRSKPRYSANQLSIFGAAGFITDAHLLASLKRDVRNCLTASTVAV